MYVGTTLPAGTMALYHIDSITVANVFTSISFIEENKYYKCIFKNISYEHVMSGVCVGQPIWVKDKSKKL